MDEDEDDVGLSVKTFIKVCFQDDEDVDYDNDNFFNPRERREAERAIKEQEVALLNRRRNKFA